MGEALSKMARDRGIAAPAGSRGSRGSRGSGGSRVGGVDGWVDLEDLEDDGDLEHLSDEALDELEAALRSEGLGVDDRATGDGDADVSEDAAMLEDAASSSIAASSDAAERAPGLDDASRRSRSRGGVAARRPRLPRLALLLSGARRLRAALASALGAARDAGSAFAESPAPRVARAARVSIAAARDAASLSVLEAFVGCYAPPALFAVRAGAVACAAETIARLVGVRAPPRVARIASSLRRAAPSGSLADAALRGARFSARVSRAYLRRRVRLEIVRRVASRIAPQKTRQAAYAARVAPIVTAYGAMKVAAPALIRDPTKRANAWRAAHALGARRAERIIRDFGGFYRKVGQIMGTASQMMPEAYVEAFAATMDDNPPVPFSRIRNIVERDFAFSRVASAGDEGVGGSSTRSFDATFASFDPTPLATASIAQVHRATLRSNGAKVVVKVLIADEATMVADVRSMLRTTQFLKAARLDNGVDFPTVFRAYLDVIRGEFDFRAEAERMDEFRALFERRGLSDRVSVPEWFPEASGAKTLASRRATGTKLLTTLRRARAAGRRPRCPPAVAARHAVPGKEGWGGVFHTVFLAWGAMLLRHGHYHSDPHPGNFILERDGRLCVLDFGQTQIAEPRYKLHLCRLVVHMVNEDYERVAEEVRAHSQVKLESPTTEALAALCYAYFDTRPSPLAEVNMMDLNNSPFLRNRVVENTREGFFTIRTVFLLRGMMKTCGVSASMVEAWEEDARATLAERGVRVPGVFASRSRRAVTRAWIAAQRAMRVGAGARINTLEAYAKKHPGPGGGGEGKSERGTPRRIRSALW